MKRLAVLSIVAVLAAGCGGGEEAGGSRPGPADAVRSGSELFQERVLGGNAGCITCHSLDPETTLVGPSMAGVAGRAGSRVAGLTAAEYLHRSIVEPSAYVVDGFDDAKMPVNWGDVLSGAQLDALVTYLLTLG